MIALNENSRKSLKYYTTIKLIRKHLQRMDFIITFLEKYKFMIF